MRKVHIALAAAALLAVAGAIVAGPKATNSHDATTMDAGFSIFDLTRRANDLPVEGYPAH